MTLLSWLRKLNGKRADRGDHGGRSMAARPRLEQLEERLTPTNFDTITNVAISINPSLTSRTATETITATVTNNDVGGPTPNAGNVNFLLNNMPVIGVPVNSSGQAIANITLPLYAVAGPQTVQAFYGGTIGGTNNFNSSAFLSPVYLNVMNELFSSNITFVGPPLSQASLPVSPFGSYKGETDAVAFFSIDFNYVDPGTIQTFTILGITLPGSLSGTLLAPIESFAISNSTQLL